MGIDLDKIREMHEAMQSGGGQGEGGIDFSKFMKVNEGSNVIRILPPKEEDEDDGAGVQVGNKTDKESGQEERDPLEDVDRADSDC